MNITLTDKEKEVLALLKDEQADALYVIMDDMYQNTQNRADADQLYYQMKTFNLTTGEENYHVATEEDAAIDFIYQKLNTEYQSMEIATLLFERLKQLDEDTEEHTTTYSFHGMEFQLNICGKTRREMAVAYFLTEASAKKYLEEHQKDLENPYMDRVFLRCPPLPSEPDTDYEIIKNLAIRLANIPEETEEEPKDEEVPTPVVEEIPVEESLPVEPIRPKRQVYTLLIQDMRATEQETHVYDTYEELEQNLQEILNTMQLKRFDLDLTFRTLQNFHKEDRWETDEWATTVRRRLNPLELPTPQDDVKLVAFRSWQ